MVDRLFEASWTTESFAEADCAAWSASAGVWEAFDHSGRGDKIGGGDTVGLRIGGVCVSMVSE